MKRYISAILILCLLLQIYSCYSLKSVRIDERLENCEKVSNKEFIVYGTGTLIDRKTNKDKIFRGQLDNTIIDSMKLISVNSICYLVCWLRDSTRVSFKQNEYVTFNLNPKSSYWIVKDIKSPHTFIVNDDNEIN